MAKDNDKDKEGYGEKEGPKGREVPLPPDNGAGSAKLPKC
jgi:hypothetical protein